MNRVYAFAAVCAIAAGVCAPVMADPLLSVGGISIGDVGAIGNPAGLPDLGLGSTGISGGSAGLPDVASITTSSSGASGSILGGGGDSISINAGGLLGQSLPSVDIALPSTGSITSGLPIPGNAQPGAPGGGGGNGANGANGVNGGNGGNGGLVFFANNGGNGTNGSNGGIFGRSTSATSSGGGTLPVASSSRLRLLMQIMAERDWIKLAANNAICLEGPGVTKVDGWLPQNDWAKFRQVVSFYSADIKTLQKMLANCRSNRQILGSAAAKRVIGLDIRNGRPVLFLL